MWTWILAQAAAQAPEATKAVTDAAATAADAAPQAAQVASDAAAPVVQQAASDPSIVQQMADAGALGYMIQGGIFMWPILILGIVALAVIIERWRSLKMLGTDTDKLRGDVLEMLHDDRIEDAMQRCDEERGPVPAILSSGLRKLFVLRRLGYDAGRIEAQVVKAMEDYGVHVVAALERHLPILGTVSAVAPMIGFLGTVAGMIVAFAEIVAQREAGGGDIIKAAAGGIQVALLTTCFGLIVGIPAFLAFNYFTSVINRFVLDVEESAAELIEAVTLQMTIDEQESGSNVQGSGSAHRQPLGVADP